MKKLLILLLFSTVLNAQLLTLFDDDVMSYFALDMDGSTEYAYINNPTGLDLNSANYLSGADDDFTAVYESDFSSGTDSWATILGTTTGNIDGAHGYNDCLVNVAGASGSLIYRNIGVSQTVGSILIFQFMYYIPNTASTTHIEIRQSSSNILKTIAVIKGSWQQINESVTLVDANTQFRFNLNNEVNTDSVYFRAITVSINNWSGLTYTSGKATFSNTASISHSNLSTSFVSGKNYTVQLKASSLASSNLKIKVGSDSTTLTTTGTETTKAWTFNYTDGDEIQLIGNGTDTYTIDDVDVSERRDISYDGYVKFTDVTGLQRVLSNRTSNLGFEIYTANASEVLTLFVGGGASSVTPTITYNLADNTWHHYVISISGNTITSMVDNSARSMSGSSIANVGAIRSTNLSFGAISTPANYLGGEIGIQTITIGNNTSIYDWDGTSDTFLDDKGTNGNDLTGVNITTDDVVEYKGGYSE